MPEKHLVLLSDNYPNSDGEFFLDDEIQLIASKFETITVLCSSPNKGNRRETPENVRVLDMPQMRSKQRFLFRIKGLFFLPLWQELFGLKKRYGIPTTFLIFKILLEDYVRASHLIQELNKHQLTDPQEHVLYSYWHNYKALAISILSKQKVIKSIARGHGWDLDYKRHKPQYLPYKNFMAKNLDLSISISDFGKKMLEEMINPKLHSNIIVSKLGKLNYRKPKQDKEDSNVYIICSCSSLIPLKRVHNIIEFCAALGLENLKWVHFGSGELLKELQLLAKNVKVEAIFKGNTPNHEILDFYHNNYVDLFINFSSSEGIPVSIMEAQSAGIPVLATAVGGTSEIVNNENGFLVEKEFNLKEVVTIIQKYLSSTDEEKQRKRNASYENWKQNYNATTNYYEFVKLLLSAKGR